MKFESPSDPNVTLEVFIKKPNKRDFEKLKNYQFYNKYPDDFYYDEIDYIDNARGA
jgi:hypothetical protein